MEIEVLNKKGYKSPNKKGTTVKGTNKQNRKGTCSKIKSAEENEEKNVISKTADQKIGGTYQIW